MQLEVKIDSSCSEPKVIILTAVCDGKVFAVTNKGEYTLRLRLYEIEERLPPHQFVRWLGEWILFALCA